MKTAGRTAEDLDFLEIKEAFASVVLHLVARLGLGVRRVKVNGGATALGHPIGASGARAVVCAVHELVRRGIGKAAVARCGVGGPGWGAAAITLRIGPRITTSPVLNEFPYERTVRVRLPLDR